jgi:hypothetical protein
MGQQVLEILDWPPRDRMADRVSLTKWNEAMFLGYVRPHGSNPATCPRYNYSLNPIKSMFGRVCLRNGLATVLPRGAAQSRSMQGDLDRYHWNNVAALYGTTR